MTNETLTAAELETLYRKSSETIAITDVAKIIRKELKSAFPTVKFSVRVSTYSMGCHINIGYTDGPPSKAVEAITDQFYGTGFDGMTDSTTYHDSDWNGKRVHFAGSRPSVTRHFSNHEELMSRIRRALDCAQIANPCNYALDWMALSSLDLRWNETPERAVAKLAYAGI